MRTRAAVALEAGKPLEIMEVNLDGPKAGEVLVEIKATGLCHTDEFTRSGDDPEGIFPAILGHEGAGVVIEVGDGVTSLEVGDHVIPLYTPECRECDYCLNPKTNLCQSIRATQGQGLLPDGSTRFSHARRHADSPLHGLLDLRQPHGRARDRAGQGPQGRALRQDLLYRLRRHHRHRRGDQHSEGRDRLEGHRLRPRRHRAQRHPGAQAGGGGPDRRRRPQPGQGRDGDEVRHDRFRQPVRGGRGPGRASGRTDRRRRGLHLRRHRQCRRDAHGARSGAQGLGRIDHHRRGPRRGRDLDPPLPAGHRPQSGAAPPSAALRAGRMCRRSSTGTWTAKSRSTR